MVITLGKVMMHGHRAGEEFVSSSSHSEADAMIRDKVMKDRGAIALCWRGICLFLKPT